MRSFIAIAAVAACTAFLMHPANADPSQAPSISVSGSGSVQYAPDIARLSLGVRAESTSAAAAAKSVNTRAQDVINAVRGVGIAESDIATSNYTIEYQPPQQDSMAPQPMIAPGQAQTMSVARKPLTPSGTYVATESIDVKAPIGKAGAVLDAAVAGGSNETYGLSFDTSQRTTLYREALARAVADARSQAEILAKAAGVRIGGVQSISAGGGEPVPMFRGPMMAMQAAGAPVMGGTATVDATVNIVYKIR